MTLLLWVSVGSFIAGFLSGVVYNDALDLYRAARKESDMPTSRITNRVLTAGLYIALVLNFLLGVMLIQQRATVANTARDFASYSRCTADWQRDFYEATSARYNAAKAVSSAMDEVIKAVATKDTERFRVAITKYLAVREEQNSERRRSPLPPLPDKVCGAAPKGAD